jgi:UDP-glucose 4-epimerase
LRDEPLTVHGDGEQTRDFTFVDTVARVLADAAARRVTCDRPVNLAYGTSLSVNDLLTLLAAELGRPPRVVGAPTRRGDVRHSRARGDTVRRLFPDVDLVPFRTGLRRTIDWMAAAGEPSLASAGRPA